MQLTIRARPPFSLPAVIGSHGWSGLVPFTRQPDFSEMTYVDRLASGRVVELGVEPAEGGVRVQAPGRFSKKERTEVEGKVSWMLGLEQDFSSFYKLARKEPKLAHVRRQARGRVLRCPTLFEDAVKTILTTNTTWGGTKRMVQAVVSQYGDQLADDPERQAFPTPAQVAAGNEQTLRSTVGLGYRAPYVLELADRTASGDLDLEALKASQLPTTDLRDELLAIKGVGGYAAANLLMLLGRYDYLPIDSWALKVVSHEWHDDQPIGSAEVEAAFESWGEWKGLAFWCWNWSYEY